MSSEHVERRLTAILAGNSSFTYKGPTLDVKQVVGRELGVRYVLEGSVRKVANRVRITGQLVDTATGPIFGQTGLMVVSATSSICRTR